ncbi:MAG: Spo0E family sporulation regulatory protein-aspartic acid phosphatase [Clostridia bacterium]
MKKITNLREELENMIEIGKPYRDIVKKSQELDLIIVEYMIKNNINNRYKEAAN